VPANRQLSIGAFSLLTGLSIDALRYYDEIGLLRPVSVDPSSRYRRYDRGQLEAARTIRALREVDMPIDEVVIAIKSRGAEKEALERHLERLLERSSELIEQVAAVSRMIEEGAIVPALKGSRIAEISLLVGDIDRSRAFYESVFDVSFAEDEHDGPKHLHTSFGSWPGDNFFMFTLWPAKDGAVTTTHFGFMVDDLDVILRKAIAAGATAFWEPRDSDAMPRNAKFADPDANEIFLYEA
jgi:DNA-binding transcriptional MerR regulator